ncbi:MAG: M48 family metalloprotease [Chromatiales bacterium]|jgi:beta-barrel assembly-enhancing protease|nr:M48 family metalloprotease [Chromatiales bacterium]
MNGLTGRASLVAACIIALTATPAFAQFKLNNVFGGQGGFGGIPSDESDDSLLGRVQQLKSATTELSQEREVALGRGVAARLFGILGLVQDASVQRYVNDLGWWLASHTERRDLPWRFGVADSQSIGAFATPGGHIIVTRGLIAVMQDEHQLAGVLAHEIAHVVGKHHLQAIMRDAKAGLIADMGARALGRLTGSDSSDDGFTREVIRATMQVYGDGLPVKEEVQADALGAVIATRAGYDPAGLAALLFTLDALNRTDAHYALMAATHPSTRDRIDAAEAALDDELGQYSSSLSDNNRFKAMQARLLGL